MYSEVIQLHVYMYLSFKFFSHLGFLQNIEQLSLCYAMGPPYWLSTVGRVEEGRLGMWDEFITFSLVIILQQGLTWGLVCLEAYYS